VRAALQGCAGDADLGPFCPEAPSPVVCPGRDTSES
jgi:hypothetical protein